MAALHRGVATPFALVTKLALVGPFAEVWVLLEEVLVASLKEVHLGEEDLLLFKLGALCLVDAAVQVSQSAPEARSSLLAELAVEDDDGPRGHQVPQLAQIVEELALQSFLAVDVYRTLDVPTVELVVEAAVNYDDGMRFRLEQLRQSRSFDRIAARIESLVIVHQWKKFGPVVPLEKLILDAERVCQSGLSLLLRKLLFLLIGSSIYNMVCLVCWACHLADSEFCLALSAA